MRDDSIDVLLAAYLAAPREADADEQLARILDEIARPLIQRVVSSVYRDWAAASDAEDVVADALTDLLRRLRDLREDPSQPIHDLRGYIVTCAYNRCHERLRKCYPARNRLRNQLQYLCGHDARLALWRTSQGVLVCGPSEWSGRDPLPAGRADQLRLTARSDPAAENRAQIAKLVFTVFRETGGPLDLDTLVATVARAIHLEQQRVEVPLTSLAHHAPQADSLLELRASLRALWHDVQQLAPKQRAALLLNLRDAHGRECLSLLPLTRTATIAQIAAAVEMPPERFAALWNDLPLSDAAIANLLGMTQRQIIKLRRLARERLRRLESKRRDRNLGDNFDSSPAAGLVPR